MGSKNQQKEERARVRPGREPLRACARRCETEPLCEVMAAILHRWRLRHGLALRELARRTGYRAQMVSYAEKMDRGMSLDLFIRLSVAHGREPHEALALAGRVLHRTRRTGTGGCQL